MNTVLISVNNVATNIDPKNDLQTTTNDKWSVEEQDDSNMESEEVESSQEDCTKNNKGVRPKKDQRGNLSEKFAKTLEY